MMTQEQLKALETEERTLWEKVKVLKGKEEEAVNAWLPKNRLLDREKTLSKARAEIEEDVRAEMAASLPKPSEPTPKKS